jgi:hypothetical protein
MRKIGILFLVAFAATSMGCGKSKIAEFSPPDGRFSIQMPGKPRKEEMSFGNLRLTMYGDVVNDVEYAVGYVDQQANLPDSHYAFMMDGIVNSFVDGAPSVSFSTRSGVANGQGTRDFEFGSEKYNGSVSGRVVLARGRIYLVYAAGKNGVRSNPDVQKYLDSFQLTDGSMPGKNETETPASSETASGSSRPHQSNAAKPPRSSSPVTAPTTVLSPVPADSGATALVPMPSPQDKPGKNKPQTGGDQPEKSKMVGFNIGPEFEDAAPEGALLVGFYLGFGYYINSNNDTIVSLQPIYRVGDKDKLGTVQGTDTRRVIRELARPGYAVGAIHAKATLALDGFYITYMKIDGTRLDPNDSYNSSWLGGPGGEGPTSVSGDGRQVVGVIGRNNRKDVISIGLMYGPPLTELIPVAEKNKPEPPNIPKCARFIGGWNDPEFADVAPAGGLLVGFDIGYGGLGNSIVTIRPIYQVKGKAKDVTGLIHGTEIKRSGKDRAKPGYAVGAIKVKGALWVDGFSIVYMKVADDKLDPTDTYESAWFGNEGKGEEQNLLTGEGAPAIGILGRQGRRDLNALGLVFKQEKNEKSDKDMKDKQ